MKRLPTVLLLFALLGYVGSAWADEGALKTGIDAYVYAYPLVLMDVTRLYCEKVTGAFDNEFFRGPVFVGDRSAAYADGIASVAWLDLSREPVILHMPPGRSVQLMDAWTNVFATPSGGQPRDFLIVGPSWDGDVPSAMTVISSPTEMALILVPSPGAVGDSVVSQDPMSLTPLSSAGKQEGAPVEEPPAMSRLRQAVLSAFVLGTLLNLWFLITAEAGYHFYGIVRPVDPVSARSDAAWIEVGLAAIAAVVWRAAGSKAP